MKNNVKDIKVDMCVYDFGLRECQLTELKSLVTEVIKPIWDLQYPFQERIPDYKKYVTVAPFAKKYFPGYDTYIWLDADTWCQNSEALKLLIKGAKKGRLAVITSTDRNYPSPISGGKIKIIENFPFGSSFRIGASTYLSNTIRRCYSSSLANKLFFGQLLNAGVYALRADSPHWQIWENSLRSARFRGPHYLSDQVPLNHAYYTSNFPTELLPAWCNWLCNVCLPSLDEETGQLVEPNLPHYPISIIHLVRKSFSRPYVIKTVQSGQEVQTLLTYSGFMKTRAAILKT